jgi:hypothetical protein
MATISNTPRPGYAWDATDNVWYPIGTGPHTHADYITSSSAINPTIVDAKGDIITATAADTPARLAVGNNGETLIADSSTATGLRYIPLNNAGKNAIINSGFDIWQRGTSLASVAAYNNYTADRYPFNFGTNTTATISRQLTNDTTNLPFIEYCARMQRNSGATTVANLAIHYTLENLDSARFAGQTVTFSFYARAGANYSSASNVLNIAFASGTGTDQSIANGLTGQTNFISSTATLTTTWQRFTYTGTVPTTATQIGFLAYALTSGTAGANDYYEMTGLQLELGSTATAYSRNAGTIQGELAACQRYYFRAGLDASGAYGVLGNSGYTNSTTNSNVTFNLPVHMRVTPTAIDYPTLSTTRILNLGAPFTPTAASLSAITSTADIAWVEFTGSGMTASQFSQYTKNNSATAYIGFSAEL